MCRIQAKTLHLWICLRSVPFVCGWLLISLLLSNNRRPKGPLAPTRPISIHIVKQNSTWIGLSTNTSEKLNWSRSNEFLWIVTPTFCRSSQQAELTRVAQAILPFSERIKWLIYDDAEVCDENNLVKLKELLKPFKLMVRVRQGKRSYFKTKWKKNTKLGKGGLARSTGISYLRKHDARGVLFFADDDNTYDSQLFEQMLNEITVVGAWPVGAMYSNAVSSPVVSRDGRVIDLYDAFKGNRKFPVDFAGFAINVDLLFTIPDAAMRNSRGGYMETYFLSDLKVDLSDFIPLAENCTEVLAWHTRSATEFKWFSTNGRNVRNSSNFVFDFLTVMFTGDLILQRKLETTNIPHLYSHYFTHIHNDK